MPIINCNLCGSSGNRFLFTRSDEVFGKQDVLQCNNCGLVFADPLPRPELLNNHYDDFFFTKKFNYVESGKIWHRFYELNLGYIERIKNKGRLLEVGCGLGHFLDVAKRRGWDTFGVELSSFASKYAKDNFGLNIFNGLLEQAGLADNYFDVVVLWATLEHLTDPLEKLTLVNRALAKNGLLCLSIPNHNSINTRIFGMQKTDMQYCEHIYHFPFRTLKMMLEECGFMDLRRMVIFGGSPRNSRFHDLMQFIARGLNLGSDMRVIAFKN
jgi:SAM-dependent methyltransferase